MANLSFAEILEDLDRLHEMVCKALPDEGVDREDVAQRLQLFFSLNDRRFRLEGLADRFRGELTEDLKQALEQQETQRGKHTLYSIAARHHRVEPYEADWKGKDCQSVRVTLPQNKGSDKQFWTRLGVVKSSDHLLFSTEDVIEHYR